MNLQQCFAVDFNLNNIQFCIMMQRDELHYSKLHTWLSIEEGKIGIVGITGFDGHKPCEIMSIVLPCAGSFFNQDEIFGSIELSNTSTDIFMPVAGRVLKVNKKLRNNPGLLLRDPYYKGWILKIAIADLNEIGHLLVPSVYQEQYSLRLRKQLK